MKKVYILFCWSQTFGGGQNYVNSKIQYLERNNWNVVVFTVREFSDDRIVWNNIKKYKNNINYNIGYSPYILTKNKRTKVLQWMKERIDLSAEKIIIESCTDITAQWGELLAKEVNGKNFCFLLDERLEEYEAIPFLYFKFSRGEVAGIHSSSIPRLFKAYNVTDGEKYVLVAANNGSVADVENEKVRHIPHDDWNIAYLGRDKGYVKNIVNGVYNFSRNHIDHHINFIIMGDITSANNLQKPKNLTHINIGFLNPIPKSFFQKVDVIIAGAGCAKLSAREGCLTIVADAKTFMSNGILGISTKNSLFSDVGESYEETLEKVLVKKIYHSDDINIEPMQDSNMCYADHFKYINKSSEKVEYYNFDDNPQKIGLKHKIHYFKNSIKFTLLNKM